MFLLVYGLGFGYDEVTEMEHTERIKWIEIMAKHHKELAQRLKDVPRGGPRVF